MEFWSYLRDALSPRVLRTYRCWRETEVPFAAASGFFLHLSFVGSLFHVKEQGDLKHPRFGAIFKPEIFFKIPLPSRY